jgi:hypothetical protein
VKVHSIFKNFCTPNPNVNGTTPMHPSSPESFPKTPRTLSEASWFSGSHNYKIKQTTFLQGLTVRHESNARPEFLELPPSRSFIQHKDLLEGRDLAVKCQHNFYF